MTYRLSRLLSYVLRHHPEEYGLSLDESGWVGVETLLAALSQRGVEFTPDTLAEIVRANDKQRFSLSADRLRIRANQGHSVSVDLMLAPSLPPPTLYHGTVGKALPSIRERGLSPRARTYVHLSADVATARLVAARRGAPIVIEIHSRAMVDAEHVFYRSENGVWLTRGVPREFIRFPTVD